MSARPIIAYQASTLEAEDIPRLQTLQLRVEAVMQDGRWHSLEELSRLCGGTEASCSARLRDLRKNGWRVDRQRKSAGLFLYRATKPEPEPQQMELL